MKFSMQILSLSLLGLSIIGCGGDESTKNATHKYEVSITNLTYAQPFSPMTLLAHDDTFSLYTLGEAASPALELLSEGGDNSALLALGTIVTGESGDGIILPGATQTLTLKTKGEYLSLASMMVNTNDGFVGDNSIAIKDLEKGESMQTLLASYDAGTESNSETAATIPGPAGGGEGFNAARDDVNFVSNHAGVITHDDGLTTSALSVDHKWDNPTAKLVIKRIN